MIEQVEQTIGAYNMLQQGESVTVGLSGGADSVALLLCLHRLSKKNEWTLRAVHLNHNLRGKESDGDEEFVSFLCARLGIPLVSHSLPIEALASEEGISIEECARGHRYRLFALCGTDKVATAHTLSDSVETTLFNLARGTGIRGLTGIPPKRDNIIRPLIHSTRDEVEAFLATQGQVYRTDSSNETTKYTRNYIRLELIPRLERVNPKLEHAVDNMQQLLTTDAAYLEELAALALAQMITSEGRYSRAGYLETPKALQGRLLRTLLLERGADYSKGRIDLISEMIREGKGTLQLSSDLYLESTEESFGFLLPTRIEKEFKISFELEKWHSASEVRIFHDKTMYLYLLDYEELENIAKKSPQHLKNLVDYDKLEDRLQFRSRQAGDSYRPQGRGCTKTLKKLFSEGKQTLEERSRTVILAGSPAGGRSGGRSDGSSGKDEIYWVEGFGASQQVAPTNKTKKILLIMTES